jgi:hypothetical protein
MLRAGRFPNNESQRCRPETFVLPDAIRGVDAQPGDSARAVEAMQAAGVRMVIVEDLAEEPA